MAEAENARARRPRRRVFLVVTLAAAAALAVWLVWGLEPFLERWVSARLVATVKSQAGCAVDPGNMALDLAAGRLMLDNLVIDCQERGHLRVGGAVIDFEILPLMAGRLRLASVTVSDPVLRWQGPFAGADRAAGNVDTGDAGNLSIGRFALRGGTLEVVTEAGMRHRVEREDLRD